MELYIVSEAQKRFDAVYINAEEVADTLGVQPSTLYKWISRGAFPEPLLANRKTYLWERDAIKDALIQRGYDAANP